MALMVLVLLGNEVQLLSATPCTFSRFSPRSKVDSNHNPA